MKYLLNLTKTTLTVGKYTEIPAGKYAPLTAAEAESTEVIYAVRASWASLHDSPPKEIDVEKGHITFEVPATMGTLEVPTPEPVKEEAPVAEVEEVVEAPAVEAETEAEAPVGVTEEVEAPKTTRKPRAK